MAPSPSIPRRPRLRETSTQDAFTKDKSASQYPSLPYNDDSTILLVRKYDASKTLSLNDPDVLRIKLGLLKQNSSLVQDLFDLKLKHPDLQPLRQIIHDRRQDTLKRFTAEGAICFTELVRFFISRKVSRWDNIEGKTCWEVFVGVRTALEWAKKPGYIWEGDNIFVAAASIPVAEWLGTSEGFKDALMAKKKLLEKGAPTRGMRS